MKDLWQLITFFLVRLLMQFKHLLGKLTIFTIWNYVPDSFLKDTALLMAADPRWFFEHSRCYSSIVQDRMQSSTRFCRFVFETQLENITSAVWIYIRNTYFNYHRDINGTFSSHCLLLSDSSMASCGELVDGNLSTFRMFARILFKCNFRAHVSPNIIRFRYRFIDFANGQESDTISRSCACARPRCACVHTRTRWITKATGKTISNKFEFIINLSLYAEFSIADWYLVWTVDALLISTISQEELLPATRLTKNSDGRQTSSEIKPGRAGLVHCTDHIFSIF